MKVDLQQLAMDIAVSAHQGQADKAGKPYIFHCIRVATTVRHLSERLYIIGLLHDVMEDHPRYAKEIKDKFPSDIFTALDVLNRNNFDSYESYYFAVSNNPMAMIVKLADIKDNSCLSRLSMLDVETRTRLIAKYEWALMRMGVQKLFNDN